MDYASDFFERNASLIQIHRDKFSRIAFSERSRARVHNEESLRIKATAMPQIRNHKRRFHLRVDEKIPQAFF